MNGYSIDSAHIVRVLARHGHTHRCTRCEARMLVKYESNLCVHCFNDLRTSSRADSERRSVAAPVTEGARTRQRLRAGEVPMDLDDREIELGPLPALGS
jgi:hypothetical protein